MKNSFFKKLTGAILAFVMVFGIAACVKPEKPKTDLELVKEALGSITLPAEVSANLTLPALDADKYPDVALTFKSSNTAAITDAGVVTRSLTADVSVTFAVTAKKGDSEDFKNFTIKVLKRDATDAEKVAAAKEALVLSGIDSLSDNITLPSTGEAGSAITWATSDATVITAAGVINPNAYGGANKTATLTATITIGTSSDTKAFAVTVLPKGLNTVVPTNTMATAALDNTGKTLTLSGTVVLDAASQAERTITLLVGKDTGMITLSNRVLASETTDGSYEFELDLESVEAEALAANVWHDLRLTLTESGVSKTFYVKVADLAGGVTLAQTAQISETLFYTFANYGTDLKLAKNSTPHLDNEVVRILAEDDKVFLEISGLFYYNSDTTLERNMTVHIIHSNLTETVVLENLAIGADTRAYLFRCELSDTDNINTEAYGDWLTLKYFLSETMSGTTRSYEDKDVSLAPAVTGEENAVYVNDFKAYFVAQDGQWLKLIVRNFANNIEDFFLSTTTMINLTEDSGSVYLNMSGVAHIGSGVGYTGTITVKIGGEEAGSVQSADGSFTFQIELTEGTPEALEAGIKFYFSKSDGAVEKEIKQAAWDYEAGAIVAKPSGGIAVLNDCGMFEIGLYRYMLVVDQWNNIKVKIADRLALDMRFEQRMDGMYLILEGNIATNWAETDRQITGIAFDYDDGSLDPIDGINNLYVGDDNTCYIFEINLDEKIEANWWKLFAIVYTENGTTYRNFKIDPVGRNDSNEEYFESGEYKLRLIYNQVYYYSPEPPSED